jgi:hypothetical protein
MKLNDTGTPANTTSIIPVNLNTSSGYSAVGSFYKGANITGLSGGNEFLRFKFTSEDETNWYNFNQDIIVENNGVFTLYSDRTVNIIVTIPFNYHSLH